jgi:hypothetical protein
MVLDLLVTGSNTARFLVLSSVEKKSGIPVVWSNIQGVLLLVLINTRTLTSEGANARILQQRQEAEEKSVACKLFVCWEYFYRVRVPMRKGRISSSPSVWDLQNNSRATASIFLCSVREDTVIHWFKPFLLGFVCLLFRHCTNIWRKSDLLLTNTDCCQSDGWSSCRSDTPGIMYDLCERLEIRAWELQVYCNGL